MDDIEDDARFTPKTQSLNRSRKVPLYTHPIHSQYNYDYILNDAEEEEEFGEENYHQEADENYTSATRYAHNFNSELNDDVFNRYPKRQRKFKTLASADYELVPRSSGRLYGNLSLSPDWSEHEKFVLLEVWGDRFLQLGRNSLRSEHWVEVAEKVSESTKINRTESQCKQIMDVLKRKYKKEKAKCGGNSKWPCFRKMDMLMNQEYGGGASSSNGGGNGFSLACGVDSGEFVFMDTNVYLELANGNDEMRDSPCESEEEEEEGEGEGSGGNEEMKGLRVLADSVQKFGEIYEKIENSKREQMLELEKMRVEFQRELELQKKQILEKAQAEIAKIREADDEEEDEDDSNDDDDDSAEDVSE